MPGGPVLRAQNIVTWNSQFDTAQVGFDCFQIGVEFLFELDYVDLCTFFVSAMHYVLFGIKDIPVLAETCQVNQPTCKQMALNALQEQEDFCPGPNGMATLRVAGPSCLLG